jgi:cobalt-zinc-cadmium efflux system membrane fusion protein
LRTAVITVVCVLVVAAVGWYWQHGGFERARQPEPAIVLQDSANEPARLVVATAARDAMGLHTSAVEAACNPPPLRLIGSLFVDTDRLIHVRSRFDGEIISIAANECACTAPDAPPPHAPAQIAAPSPTAIPHDTRLNDGRRPLRFGDRVKRNQVLAVIWSKEVGEKKSDLIDAYSRLAASTISLERLRTIGASAVAERSVREAERARDADVIAVDRLERTLRSWHVGEQEIEEVRAAAKHLRESGGSRDNITEERRWAEIDVRSPIDGIIVEKNVAAGDIADPSDVLFKIADLSRLGVLAQVYEEDLPKIASLAPEDRRWLVRLKANPEAPPIVGTFELIGNIVDPRQHAAAIVGWIDNTDGRLLIGQFITAEIQLPAPAGAATAIFVTGNADGDRFERRQVALSRRAGDRVFVRCHPTPAESEAGCVSLAVGEWVVDDGAVELEGAWSEQQGPTGPVTANPHAVGKQANVTAPSPHN